MSLIREILPQTPHEAQNTVFGSLVDEYTRGFLESRRRRHENQRTVCVFGAVLAKIYTANPGDV